MKRLIFILLTLSCFTFVQAQKSKTTKEAHYVCFPQSSGEYHNNQHCSRLQLCSGGRSHKIENIGNLKPCKKCVKQTSVSSVAPVLKASGFEDIKRVLGVKDKKQIVDSLGTDEGTIHRPEGYTIRISGLPQSAQVNTLEFYLDKPIAFDKDTLTSATFYKQLGLQFEKCQADTIQNKTPHPVTGKVKRDFSIEYRGCALIEPRDKYEDVSKYFYELLFVSKEGETFVELEKVMLVLKVDRQ